MILRSSTKPNCFHAGTKALWLEENNIKKIENISHMQLLRCLFLQVQASQTRNCTWFNASALLCIGVLAHYSFYSSHAEAIHITVQSNAITRISNLSRLKSLQVRPHVFGLLCAMCCQRQYACVCLCFVFLCLLFAPLRVQT